MMFFITFGVCANSLYKSYCKKVSFELDETIKNEVSKLKVDLANSKPIAAVADEALGKLIEKKSPVISSWIARRKLDVSDPVNVAKQWRLYYIDNIVLSSDSLKQRPPQIQKLVDKQMTTTFTNLYSKEKLYLLEEAFKRAKSSALMVLKLEIGKDKNYNAIKSRIESLKIFTPKKVLASKVANAPRDYLEWGFSYDPKNNEINVGLEGLHFAYPKYKATLVSLMAHEIAHAFDSCRFSGFYQGKNPFSEIQLCLRNDTSAGAKYRDDSQLAFLAKNNVLKPDVVASLKANPTCNRLLYPLPGKQKDQLDEIFADWFSAEVVAASGMDISNLRSELCHVKELQKGSSYISNEKRLLAIYLTQPTIAKKLGGIKSGHHYCSH